MAGFSGGALGCLETLCSVVSQIGSPEGLLISEETFKGTNCGWIGSGEWMCLGSEAIGLEANRQDRSMRHRRGQTDENRSETAGQEDACGQEDCDPTSDPQELAWINVVFGPRTWVDFCA